MREIKGEMIQIARESRGMTQKELTAKTGISQGHISKYELGIKPVPKDQLNKISRILDYPKSLFYQNILIEGKGDSEPFHRKRKTIPMIKQKMIQALLGLRCFEVKILLGGIEMEAHSEFPQYDIEEYDNDPETVAKLVRAEWKLRIGPIYNMIHVIERAGGIVMEVDFFGLPIDAESRWINTENPIFFIKEEAPADRIRFTLAHEIGHLVMHRKPNPDMEKQANAFAAEFLMPKDDIYGALIPFSFRKALVMKHEWKVSIAALIRRAYDLNVISKVKYSDLNRQLAVKGYKKNEPGKIPREKPSILKEIIKIFVEDLRYSSNELKKLLNINNSDFEKYYIPKPRLRLVGLDN